MQAALSSDLIGDGVIPLRPSTLMYDWKKAKPDSHGVEASERMRAVLPMKRADLLTKKLEIPCGGKVQS